MDEPGGIRPARLGDGVSRRTVPDTSGAQHALTSAKINTVCRDDMIKLL